MLQGVSQGANGTKILCTATRERLSLDCSAKLVINIVAVNYSSHYFNFEEVKVDFEEVGRIFEEVLNLFVVIQIYNKFSGFLLFFTIIYNISLEMSDDPQKSNEKFGGVEILVYLCNQKET